ncbi:MAG TPA: hypothetical protein VIK59_05435 [Verrucomicrobiae bacterium]
MPGKTTRLTARETRKQLLLVESELNRAHLLNDVRDIQNELHRLQTQVHAIGSMIASTARLAATFFSIGNIFTHPDDDHADKKKSWISNLMKGARTGASVWMKLKSYLR